MRFEWDERKNRANKKKHGLGFATAVLIFEDRNIVTVLDERFDYGEERWLSIGSASGLVVLAVVHTLTEDEDDEEIVRIISARKASRDEATRYRRHHS